MIKAIIVDDELSAIRSLKWEVEKFCKGIEITDSFTNPVEAISAINYLKPDCIFLDIEMPEMDGFQLISSLEHKNFDLIITTAYDNYALRAFKANAIDYLLKPIDTDDLLASVTKIRVNNIMYCKSSGNYSEIFFKEQKKEMLSKKLKEVEALINSDDFFRVHKSYLVNVKYIKEFVKSDGHYLVLENETTIPVARLKKNDLLDYLCN